MRAAEHGAEAEARKRSELPTNQNLERLRRQVNRSPSWLAVLVLSTLRHRTAAPFTYSKYPRPPSIDGLHRGLHRI
jgi:hypothetical protein